eukprot:SAG11_NODE_363_length_10162_cov_28.285004_11_plen_43_part_00
MCVLAKPTTPMAKVALSAQAAADGNKSRRKRKRNYDRVPIDR